MKVAVITARGGSKRIPRKNILEFHGKPMIAWSIEAAQKSGLFDKIIVSTDDNEIVEVARKYGAEVPFIRPAELADDYATTVDVMAHATVWFESEFFEIESVCCIYPTAPFLVAEDIISGYRALCTGDWLYSFSAAPFEISVYRAFTEGRGGGVEMLFPEYYSTRSQDLSISLHDAAQFYWGRPIAWKEKRVIFANYSIPVKIPQWRVVDIDTPEDLEKARSLALGIYRRLSS